jgi:hypothetical protein
MREGIENPFSPKSIPGWILSIWCGLDFIHGGTFAIEMIKKLFGHLNQHPVVLLVLGWSWLAYVVFTPAIHSWFNQHLAWFRLPWLTTEQRIHALESSVPQQLEMLRTTTSRLPEFINQISRLQGLIAGAERLVCDYKHILQNFPTSGPAERPLLNVWGIEGPIRENENRDAILLGRAWRQSLREHMKAANGVFMGTFTGWSEGTDPVGGHDCLCRLKKHASSLGSARNSYVTAFRNDPMDAKPVISLNG